MDQKIYSLERRQGEIFEIVKAIEHNQVFKVEMDSANLRISHLGGTLNAVEKPLTNGRLYSMSLVINTRFLFYN